MLAERVARIVADRGAASVAVLATRIDPPVAVAIREAVAGANLTVADVRDGLDAAHPTLLGGGPFDVVVDLTGSGEPVRRLGFAFAHLKPGGLVVLKSTEDWRALVERTSSLRAASEVEARRPGSDRRPTDEVDLHSLAAVADWTVDEDLLLVTCAERWLAKVGERDLEATLMGDRSSGRVLQRRAGSGTARFDAVLREYREVMVAPKQRVWSAERGVVWPDSFRHPTRRRLINQAFADVGRVAVRAPHVPEDAPRLTGTFLHLDNQLRGHFGHALTEQVSHLWAWPAVLNEDPDARVLIGGPEPAAWEVDLLRAAGIGADRIVRITDAVRVERLVGSTPMFSLPDHVDPAIHTVYEQIGARLEESASKGDRPDRIFVSRRSADRRPCTNADEVEAAFAEAGFVTVFPEDHPLADQVALFRHASTVAGYAGSGLFHLAFAGGPKRVVMLRSESYRVRNEALIASVVGHRIEEFVCPAEVRHGPGFAREAFQSAYRFDFDADGDRLRAVLAGLP